eukprot:29844-Pelagococcus_subviridis.AAC.4
MTTACSGERRRRGRRPRMLFVVYTYSHLFRVSYLFYLARVVRSRARRVRSPRAHTPNSLVVVVVVVVVVVGSVFNEAFEDIPRRDRRRRFRTPRLVRPQRCGPTMKSGLGGRLIRQSVRPPVPRVLLAPSAAIPRAVTQRTRLHRVFFPAPRARAQRAEETFRRSVSVVDATRARVRDGSFEHLASEAPVDVETATPVQEAERDVAELRVRPEEFAIHPAVRVELTAGVGPGKRSGDEPFLRVRLHSKPALLLEQA